MGWYPIHRKKQIIWRTVYNLYMKKKKKFATDLGDAIADDDETGVVVGGVNELIEE